MPSQSSFSWQTTVFSSTSAQFIQPWPAVLGQEIEIRLRVHREAPLAHVFLRSAPDGEQEFKIMHRRREDEFFVEYGVSFTLRWNHFQYRFLLVTHEHQMWGFNSQGFGAANPLDVFDFKLLTDYQAPAWLEKAVFYQIFPDRFYNGNPARNYRDHEYEYHGHPVRSKAWGEAPESSLDFFNGDLEGILQKLDYLQDLGVNALYLNPVFTSPSNHKYDVQDFYEIDAHLGDKEVFAKLTADLHRRGMRVILDGVFNHSGVSSRWFNGLGLYPEPGAYQTQESPYADFYTFYEHPESYECWWGIRSLPKFNYASEQLRETLYRGKNSVAKHWLQAPLSADGWRMDVANMTARQGTFQQSEAVWREIRQEIKRHFPEAYLMGEHFFDGSALLQGDTFDGLMNYQGFHFPVHRWLTGILEFRAEAQAFQWKVPFDAKDFQKQVHQVLSVIPTQVALNMYNLVNGHDRPRLISLVKRDRRRILTALVALMSFPGVPGIYYGEEIGLEGMHDPDNRRCMIWEPERWDQELRREYQHWITIRKNSTALQRGSWQWLHTTPTMLAYARFDEHETLVAVLVHQEPGEEVVIPVWPLGVMQGEAICLRHGQSWPVHEGRLRLPSETRLVRLKK